jgi:magnesium-transporting ATPase (P-type)
VAFGFVLFLYQFYCGFSGQSLVDDVSAAVYNVIFTSLPIFVFALHDRPVSRLRSLLAFPATYHPRSSLTTAAFWKTGVGVAALDAVVALCVPLYAVASPRGAAAALDVSSLGKTVFTALLACVTLEVGLVARFWTPAFAVAVLISFGLVFPFQLALQAVYAADSEQAGVAGHLFRDPRFWLAVLLTGLITFGFRFAERGGVWLFRPHDNMVLEEMERRQGGGSVKGGREGGGGGDGEGGLRLEDGDRLPQWQTDVRLEALGSRRRDGGGAAAVERG